jgi:Ca2+-binding RTX toxin-like protein
MRNSQGRSGVRSRARRVIPFTLVLAGLIALAITSVGSARAKPKCFGKTATIVGNNSSNTIQGTARNDVIYAGGGNDTIKTPSGPKNQGRDIICGGPGNDEITGNGDSEKLIGGPGNDFIKSGNGRNLVVGDNANPSGNESGQTGKDDLVGGRGADFIVGDNYASGNASGGPADKNFRAGAGADTVIGDSASVGTGGPGKADATGGGDDRMGGADGNDLVIGDSYTKTGVARGGGDDDNNSGPGNDLAVGDSYTVSGTAIGSGNDKLHAADGGDFGNKCKPDATACPDVFYGDNFRQACADNRSVAANARVDVIRCVNENTQGGGVDLLTPDRGDDFMNGGLPDPDPGGTKVDRCSGGAGTDTATSCHGIQGGFEKELPFP